MANDPQISRPTFTRPLSDFSDEKILVVPGEDGSDGSFSPLLAAEIAGALPPQHSYQFHASHHSRFPSSSNASAMSPTSTISTTSPLPSPTIATTPAPVAAFRRRSLARPFSMSTHSSGSTSRRTSSIYMPAQSTTTSAAMLGRPSKDNNYWGFCKGAWTNREDWRKGLQIAQVPAGMYSTRGVWRCKWCDFQGDVFGAKKPYMVDQRVVTARESAVRYRFLFLARSHVKQRAGKDNNTCFGCVVCVNEGRGTSIFGDVETLCNHLVVEHGQGEMSEEAQERNRCVVGRVAEVREEFDFNIPSVGNGEDSRSSAGFSSAHEDGRYA